MDDDIRCCGTGTCLINTEGFCWCGQQWDGTQMCFAPQPVASGLVNRASPSSTQPDASALAEKPDH